MSDDHEFLCSGSISFCAKFEGETNKLCRKLTKNKEQTNTGKQGTNSEEEKGRKKCGVDRSMRCFPQNKIRSDQDSQKCRSKQQEIRQENMQQEK